MSRNNSPSSSVRWQASHRGIFTPPHLAGEVFPFRVRLRPFRIFAAAVHFKPLIPALWFITNKMKWSGQSVGRRCR
jgi:predicted RNA-binding protein